jgi:hypothetical protein
MGTRVCSLWIKRPRPEADNSPPSSAEVRECLELYRHSPNMPSWRGAQLMHRETTLLLPSPLNVSVLTAWEPVYGFTFNTSLLISCSYVYEAWCWMFNVAVIMTMWSVICDVFQCSVMVRKYAFKFAFLPTFLNVLLVDLLCCRVVTALLCIWGVPSSSLSLGNC